MMITKQIDDPLYHPNEWIILDNPLYHPNEWIIANDPLYYTNKWIIANDPLYHPGQSRYIALAEKMRLL